MPNAMLTSGSSSSAGAHGTPARRVPNASHSARPTGGMSCISPTAPAADRALGRKLDSWRMTAAASAGSTPASRPPTSWAPASRTRRSHGHG